MANKMANMSGMTETTSKHAEYERLVEVRDRANEAFKKAAEHRNSWAITIADSVADEPTRDMSFAAEQYRAARGEADRLREVWFDASDAVRALVGARLIER